MTDCYKTRCEHYDDFGGYNGNVNHTLTFEVWAIPHCRYWYYTHSSRPCRICSFL